MGKITIDEMHNSLFDYAQAVSDENLMTESKTIVGAINEIYGKQLIADSIGEPLNNTDTFTKMNNDINSLLSTFKTNMMNNGVTVESNDRFKSLIDKIATMVEEGEGKGIQYAEGTFTLPIETGSSYYDRDNVYTCNWSCDFVPTILFVKLPTVCYYDGPPIDIVTNPVISNLYTFKALVDWRLSSQPTWEGKIENITTTTFDINVTKWSTYAGFEYNEGTWYAIGVGEEDTTLRDSLASILEEEGVSVTEEDDMASLITKVDEEFDNRKQILVNALVNEGLNAEITNTYEELITMISLLKYVPANSIINGDSTDSDFINRLTSYSKNRGDADSKITYSVSNNTIIVEGSADCVETTNGQADEGKRDLYIYNPSYTVDVTDYDVFKVIASYSFYDMEYGCLEVGLYTGSDYKNPVKTIENGDLDITDLTGEYHIVIIASVWNEYYLGKTGILEGKVSYIGFE